MPPVPLPVRCLKAFQKICTTTRGQWVQWIQRIHLLQGSDGSTGLCEWSNRSRGLCGLCGLFRCTSEGVPENHVMGPVMVFTAFNGLPGTHEHKQKWMQRYGFVSNHDCWPPIPPPPKPTYLSNDVPVGLCGAGGVDNKQVVLEGGRVGVGTHTGGQGGEAEWKQSGSRMEAEWLWCPK